MKNRCIKRGQCSRSAVADRDEAYGHFRQVNRTVCSLNGGESAVCKPNLAPPEFERRQKFLMSLGYAI
jgi:hypothetical protein